MTEQERGQAHLASGFRSADIRRRNDFMAGAEWGYAAAMPKWIPVGERLPEVGVTVQIVHGRSVTWAWYAGSYWRNHSYKIMDSVTHWAPFMPLPKPPEKEVSK